MLKSKLLSPSQRLNNCAIQDSAHVTRGDAGDHVKRIQQALIRIDNAKIEASDLENAATATAPPRWSSASKTGRAIINTSYCREGEGPTRD